MQVNNYNHNFIIIYYDDFLLYKLYLFNFVLEYQYYILKIVLCLNLYNLNSFVRCFFILFIGIPLTIFILYLILFKMRFVNNFN